MNILLITAITAITQALIFYTIGVWAVWLIPYFIGMFMGMGR